MTNQNTRISKLTTYLPEVLQANNGDNDQLLARILCIFEKILCGIEDDIAIQTEHQGKSYIYTALDKLLDALPTRFDPWQTKLEPWHQGDKDFLDYLAEWVDIKLGSVDILELPSGTPVRFPKPDKCVSHKCQQNLETTWDEYQKRKLIASASEIYKLQGLKEGLYTFLDIYAASAAKPRVVIDDGVAVVQAILQDDGDADLHAFAYTQQASGGMPAGLVDPIAIAAGDGFLIVAEAGRRGSDTPKPRLWQMPIAHLSGEQILHHEVIVPLTIQFENQKDGLIYPKAIVIDVEEDIIYLLDQGEEDIVSDPREVEVAKSVLYKLTRESRGTTTLNAITLMREQHIVHPVAMERLLTGSSHYLIVLDRGSHMQPPTDWARGKPQLVIIALGTNSADRIKTIALDEIREPSAMALKEGQGDAAGKWHIFIADAGDQLSTEPESETSPRHLAPDLVRFMLDPNNWDAGPTNFEHLLNADKLLTNQNPLVFPTDLMIESETSLVVCDRGLKFAHPDSTPSWERTLAKQPALYRITLTPPLPGDVEQGKDKSSITIRPISKQPKLVDPAKFAFDRSQRTLYIVDPGMQYEDMPKPDWRLQPHHFGVIIHFSTEDPVSNSEQQRIVNEIISVVNEQKPAHTYCLISPKPFLVEFNVQNEESKRSKP